jgi:hypothetical protein
VQGYGLSSLLLDWELETGNWSLRSFRSNDLTRNTSDATISAANTSTMVRLNNQLEFEYPHIGEVSSNLRASDRHVGNYRREVA